MPHRISVKALIAMDISQYSYFHNGCHLQCALLLTCQHVIPRVRGVSLSLLLAVR